MPHKETTYRPQPKLLGEEELESLAEFRTSKVFKLLKVFMEIRVADYKDQALTVEDQQSESVVNDKQTIIIKRTANEFLWDLRGRKIAFDEILGYIKECGMRYDNAHQKKKRKV